MAPIFSVDRQLTARSPYVKLMLCFTIAIWVTFTLPTQAASAESPGLALSVSWRLIDNLPDERFKSEFTLRNDGKVALANGWALYFNCERKLLPESVGKDFDLAHINGDLYVLRPAPRSKPLAPGGRRAIPLEGSLWAISISDAPRGFYIVLDEKSGQPSKPISLRLDVESFPETTKLHRGVADVLPVANAESRYAENELLAKLPGDQLIKVVPTPSDTNPLPGRVSLNSSTKIFYQSPLLNEATFLAAALGELTNGRLAIQEDTSQASIPAGSIRLRVGEVKVAGRNRKKGDEAYVLTATPDGGIEIAGIDSAGVFYGIQTLRCLLPIDSYRQKNSELSIEATRISDAPRFHYRGLHLDVARNYQTRETVEKLLDLMAFYKLNRLHLHLTDDEGWRIEIKQLPELTKVGAHRGHTLDEAANLIPSLGSGPSPDPRKSPGSGYYTQDDFIKILRKAQTRHITVIPELDLPGHARAAIKSMEARHRDMKQQGRDEKNGDLLLHDPADESKYESVQMWRDNVVDVGREDTYRFVDLVVAELSSMYERAGTPLTNLHLGGDEVPKGAWEKSPACQQLAAGTDSPIPRSGQLELHFLDRASEILKRRGIQPACWEDCLLLEAAHDPAAAETRRAAGKPTPTAYVWNNVWGWGQEDGAYRLANAGFDVVLCNATHLYFDLACEKDPLELGYYWAGFVSMRAPFEFIPLDMFKNAERTSMGQVVSEASLSNRMRLTPTGTGHILGIQGQLWGENLRNEKSVEYMGFPRIIALAERAWASSPVWSTITDPIARRLELQRDWNQFANRLGQRELPRLDFLFGGVRYRLPPPGAVVRDGRVSANVAFPGLAIRYTSDGTEPDLAAFLFQESISLSPDIKLRSFDSRGRSSRTVNVSVHD
jgi:hexosaminidase